MKLMFNLGAFAGGLAQGIRSGQDIKIRQNTADRLATADDREAETHQERMDKAGFNKDRRERLRAANEEITAGWSEARQGESGANIDPGKPGLAETVAKGAGEEKPLAASLTPGLVLQETFAPKHLVLANQAVMGLMSQYGKPSLPNPSAVQEMAANEAIGRRMLTGHLLDDSNELTRMANIYKKHGLLAEMMPWMNKAYAAKKKRIPDALHLLLNGDAKGAREALQKGGINLAEDPVPVEATDPSSNSWRFTFEDGAEKDINLKDLAGRFFPSSTLQTGE
jgi:hypothetical protein